MAGTTTPTGFTLLLVETLTGSLTVVAKKRLTAADKILAVTVLLSIQRYVCDCFWSVICGLPEDTLFPCGLEFAKIVQKIVQNFHG